MCLDISKKKNGNILCMLLLLEDGLTDFEPVNRKSSIEYLPMEVDTGFSHMWHRQVRGGQILMKQIF